MVSSRDQLTAVVNTKGLANKGLVVGNELFFFSGLFSIWSQRLVSRTVHARALLQGQFDLAFDWLILLFNHSDQSHKQYTRGYCKTSLGLCD